MSFKEEVAETVWRHVEEIGALANRGEISVTDHDTVGHILCSHIGHLIGLSPKAWEQFKLIVEESRKVHYESTATDTSLPS